MNQQLITLAQCQHQEIIFPVTFVYVVNKISEKGHYTDLIINFIPNLPI